MLINNTTTLSRCPLCAAHEIFPLGQLAYQNILKFSSTEIKLGHTPEMWKCQKCRSCFTQNIVGAETAKDLYSAGRPSERWSKLVFEQNKTKEVTKHMAELFKSKGSVLDVGCNTGELLDFAKQFGCDTTGVEFSASSRKILKEKGHASFATIDESPGEYAIITAFDLIEHLYDVSAFLNICRNKLSPNGRLAILTGNIGSLSAILSANRWWYAQYPEHIVFPSKIFFQKISGFKVEKWILTYASRGYKFPFTMVISEIAKSIFQRKTFHGLPSIGPDHVLIILKK